MKGLKGSKTLNKDPDPKNPVEGKEERLYTSLMKYKSASFSMKRYSFIFEKILLLAFVTRIEGPNKIFFHVSGIQ